MDKKFLNGTVLVIIHDLVMVPIAWFLVYWLRLGFAFIPEDQVILSLKVVLPILLVTHGFAFWYFGLYRGIWRFASLPDFIRVIKAVVSACFVTSAIIIMFTHVHGMPRSMFPLYSLMLIGMLCGSRLLARIIKDKCNLNLNSKNVLIIGAGNAGEILVRDLLRSSNHDYKPVGFIDDDVKKIGKEIHGVRVLGKCRELKSIAEKNAVELAILAMPSATADEMRQVVELCHAADIQFKTLPRISELASDDTININSLREVALEDLLGREEVEIDFGEISRSITGKTILISGGGGSIGSEICRQVARLKPTLLAIIDNSEFNIYQIHKEIDEHFPGLNFKAYLGSVCDELFVRKALHEVKPDLLFHAAAYKHVPILEDRIYTAVYNNIWGTKIIADMAEATGVKKFVLISTDKAVKPANIMGATKRFAEIICQSKNKGGLTKFITVRFGNVLGSSGSVVPLFKQQLAKGGPITVTHPEITRYFMTIPEAVRLILQSCSIGSDGEVFVLDMGNPVKISYLAEQIIKLAGGNSGKVQIQYTGLRPGEKMHEKLFYEDEEMSLTRHKKIFKLKSYGIYDEFETDLNQISAFLKMGDEKGLSGILGKIIL